LHSHGDASADGAKATLNDVEAAGGHALAVQGDLTDSEPVDALFAAAQDRFGDIDGVVNTVGREGDRLVAMTDKDADAMIAINT
jgi:NAD(P)-dependent dehydrogenase (short-subunit alcohol dehydrogenase family)